VCVCTHTHSHTAPSPRQQRSMQTRPVSAEAALAAAGFIGALLAWLRTSLRCASLARRNAELTSRLDSITAAKATQHPSMLADGAGPRTWRGHLAGLDKMVSELLREARLLASELNKDGDIRKVVQDPTKPTLTVERKVGRLSVGQACSSPFCTGLSSCTAN